MIHPTHILVFSLFLRLTTSLSLVGPSFWRLADLKSSQASEFASQLEGISPSDVFVQRDTLVLSPQDGLTLSCNSPGNFQLRFQKPSPSPNNLANFMARGPIIVSHAFSNSCPLLANSTILGVSEYVPKDWQDAVSSYPELLDTVIEPLVIESVTAAGIDFVGAVKDYHSLFGTVVPIAGNTTVNWLQAGVEPWHVITGSLQDISKRFIITSVLIGGAIHVLAAGAGAAAGGAAVYGIGTAAGAW